MSFYCHKIVASSIIQSRTDCNLYGHKGKKHFGQKSKQDWKNQSQKAAQKRKNKKEKK